MIDNELLSLKELVHVLDWGAFLFLALTLILLLIGKIANQSLVNYKLNHELTTADNKAVAVSFSGFILSIGVILHGVLRNPSPSGYLWEDLTYALLWGGVGCLFLLLSRAVNDRFLLPSFSNQKELISDRNIGVGLVQAGGYLSSALMVKGILSGLDVEGIPQALMWATIWFIASQLLLLIYAFAYEKLTSFKLHTELKSGNIAVGISFSGSLIAFGILMSFYLEIFSSILGLLFWVFIATLSLKLVRLIIDKILLPASALDNELCKDRNWGVALIDAVTSIIAALILTGSLF